MWRTAAVPDDAPPPPSAAALRYTVRHGLCWRETVLCVHTLKRALSLVAGSCCPPLIAGGACKRVFRRDQYRATLKVASKNKDVPGRHKEPPAVTVGAAYRYGPRL